MSSEKKVAENMLWGGRFTQGLDPVMEQYNASLPYDRLFYAQDIAGSIAFARANKNNGILTADEFAAIEKGFVQIKQEWANNTFEVKANDEDIHTANERRLSEIIGKDIGGKLHTGRSRNEQVATDMRLWLRDQLHILEDYLKQLIKTSVQRAEAEIDVLMPGYTHLQKAQPIRWSHFILGHATAFSQELERLREVIKRVNRSPLGCGALAGNPFNIDRDAMAKELGFEGILPNSLNAVGDRDFVFETLQWGSSLMLKLSRWAEDLIIYSSLEFGFVRLADAYSTGSSLMPQKKNADSLELIRGKSGRAFGHMAGLYVTIKGLPTTYNKDLQESVEPLIDHVKTVGDSLQIATGVISTLTVNKEKMYAALAPEMLATEFADYLVRKGVPFREGHHISGRVVAAAEQNDIPMDKLSLEQLKAIDSRLGDDVVECLDYERAVELKNATGGTSKSACLEQIAIMKQAFPGLFAPPVFACERSVYCIVCCIDKSYLVATPEAALTDPAVKCFNDSTCSRALSRSDKKILHVDENDYYGGAEAAFSLQEAEEWERRVSNGDASGTFDNVKITKHEPAGAENAKGRLGFSRAYSLALSPQIIYAKSSLLQHLVSSRVYRQLEFLAVGSWWVYTHDSSGDLPKKLLKVPNGREDVFQDHQLDFKAKRALMKFLRFITDYEEQTEVWDDHRLLPFPDFLSTQFKIPASLQGPLLALALSPSPSSHTTTDYALPRIARHLRSIGVFGPGFGAVIPKWGGLAEISQVSCRACAVGGGVYVLGKGLTRNTDAATTPDGDVKLHLKDGEVVTAKWVVGGSLPTDQQHAYCRSTTIVASPLAKLFPPIAEEAPAPASAVVVFPSGSLSLDDTDTELPPVHVFIHSSDTGECPSGQCILYASTSLDSEKGFELLQKAVDALLVAVDVSPTPDILWFAEYRQRTSSGTDGTSSTNERVLSFPPPTMDLAFDDAILDDVKGVWRKIVGEEGGEFLVFQDREAYDDDE
ncbi:hypothetical protein OPT61_g1448 [Boeremia exigua]|uniref:Uncharacterized protein n=1 Tax=Boeremia exigua TaxID=749465 RepID=A0ACC2IQB4_9PLEO|nr:hypothetical protein OPT61_g1448 [Boeremia exigua]